MVYSNTEMDDIQPDLELGQAKQQNCCNIIPAGNVWLTTDQNLNQVNQKEKSNRIIPRAVTTLASNSKPQAFESEKH